MFEVQKNKYFFMTNSSSFCNSYGLIARLAHKSHKLAGLKQDKNVSFYVPIARLAHRFADLMCLSLFIGTIAFK
ncbi:hypothetical protein TEHN7126_2009 [Tetragenococcus halophilus subsp. halophilus]|nr:hypothetical protein TEHN0098T_0679 [Tetragenococcus halophilus subsp. halophilus]GBD62857.1 hypothetical protein TEHD23766T_0284 [Tetragenococcus halophilus subsp. flandriensis]GFK24936.1 hypothetical protein YA163_19990 [Tetragenococcus halophilus]GMA45588.1 hypothetical protein GCM10025853_30450 [Tetragenococcus halophilus subsp. halophilus DSM 20339]GBD73272.1 hypothetical protein TEHN7125_1432 [Tetragenococcus halophilus subsp. halophilus]